MKINKMLVMDLFRWILIILSSFALAFLFESEVFAMRTIKKNSMENTLFENQKLAVDAFSYKFKKPDRGDIIIFFPNESKGNLINKLSRFIDGYKSVFTKEEYHERYIKRVIAIEDDMIDITDGYVLVNGMKIDEPYVKGITEPRGYELPYLVGKDELFVMGDNRIVSEDSRHFGPINIDQVEGKAVFRIFPFNEFGKIE